MKKILVLTLFTILLVQTSSSQILIALLFGDKLNSERIEFGLNVGANFSTLSNVDADSYSAGFNIGMNFVFKINDKFHLNPALFFSYPMGANFLPLYDTPDEDLNNVLNGGDLHRKLSYFSLPITMRYRLFGLTFIEAGPQISLKQNAVDVFSVTIQDRDEVVYNQNIREEYTLFDFGVTAGFTQKLRKQGGISISLKYYQGLIDVSKNATNQKNSAFYATVAIPIGADPKDKKVKE